MKYVSCLSLAILSIATAAHAESTASLTGVSGPVMVNKGQGFVPALGPDAIALKPGDRVLLRDEALATVAYAECAVTLSQPSLFVVTKDAPCAKGAALPQGSYMVSPTATDGGDLQGEALFVSRVITGAMILGTGAVVVLGLTDDDDDPASPN